MDNLTKKQRKKNMANIKRVDTTIELLFRKYIWSKGLRGYRTDYKNIPGRPDIYFIKKKIAVFIDGCYWHKCPKCFVRPKSHNNYWDNKIENNVKRDKKYNKLLKKKGITVIRFWEHQVKDDINKCYSELLETYENKQIKKLD